MATAILEDPSGYGRVVRDPDGAVQRVVETKAQGDSTQAEREIREVNTGIFVFAAPALRSALPRLSTDNAQGELYLPQVLDLLRGEGVTVAAHVLADPVPALGVNDRVGLARSGARPARDPRAPPARRRRDPRAGGHGHRRRRQIGQDTLIEPFSTIRGTTRIGRSAPSAIPTSSTACSRTGRASGRSPICARVRSCDAGAKVGTFVEVKNSDIGAGAKVPHLSYIGDADVGEGDEPRGAARSPPTTTGARSTGRRSERGCVPGWTPRLWRR